MDQVQPYQILIPLAMAILIGILSLIWDDRPDLAAAIRTRLFAARPPATQDAMSSDDDDEPVDEAVADPGAQPSAGPLQPIATPCNNDNAALRDNTPAQLLPEAVRDIIRHQAKAETVAALLESKLCTNQAQVIEVVFGCTRNSRPDSTYSRARAAVEGLRTRSTARDKIDEVTPTGEVIRRDATGERYMIDETRQRLPV